MKKVVASLIAVSMAVAPMGLVSSYAADNKIHNIKSIDARYSDISNKYGYTCTGSNCKFVDKQGCFYGSIKVGNKEYKLNKKGQVIEKKKSHKLRNAAMIVGTVAAGVAAYKYLGKECDKAGCDGTFPAKRICNICEAQENLNKVRNDLCVQVYNAVPAEVKDKTKNLMNVIEGSNTYKKMGDYATTAKNYVAKVKKSLINVRDWLKPENIETEVKCRELKEQDLCNENSVTNETYPSSADINSNCETYSLLSDDEIVSVSKESNLINFCTENEVKEGMPIILG